MSDFVASADSAVPGADVSVVIPSYNRLWCLPRAVDSCRGTRCRTQIIVVDDGSSDGTWEWLQAQSDVVALRQANQGQTWAINYGQRHSIGTYIRFLDSDDFLNPGMIDRQFETAVATGADVVYGRVELREEESGKIFPQADPPMWDDFVAVMLGEGYGSHFLGMLFRAAFVCDIPRRPEVAFREDRMFLLEVALRKPRIHPMAGCVGHWVKHDRNMHDSYAGLQRTIAAWQTWQIYQLALGRLAAAGELTPRRAKAAAGALWPVAHVLAHTHLSEAHAIVRRIYQLDPTFVPPQGKLLRWLYAGIGYQHTQRLLRVRRALRGGLGLDQPRPTAMMS
jgi:glycosyltransferase involved in cell wall biosynthesis